ncbi:UNVERIFIED_CONTAM: hypothetical protein GTU68_016558, partial [Idotea baltica]|nr:hypothetical protein [Idotea baltica]
ETFNFAALLFGRSLCRPPGSQTPLRSCTHVPARAPHSWTNPLKKFSELKLIAPLERALRDQNYEVPTPIQAQTIPHALEGKDILGCAQTGTGKTAAFSLPMLDYLGAEFLKAKRNKPQALVLAPTRELAIQIGDSIKVYGKHLKLRTALIFGGVNQNAQVRSMNSGVHIVVATPGRLIDLMNQGHVDLRELEIFVLDEADRMLDMGFLPDLKRIIKTLPKNRQSMFFSATMAPKIVELAGIDIDNVTHVVNYDLPNEAEAYVHRIGRTGRAGATGTALSFCAGDELDYLRDIEKLIGNEIPRDPDSIEPAYEPPKKQGGGRRGGSTRRAGSSKSSHNNSGAKSRKRSGSKQRRGGAGDSGNASAASSRGRSSKSKRPGKNARSRNKAVSR